MGLPGFVAGERLAAITRSLLVALAVASVSSAAVSADPPAVAPASRKLDSSALLERVKARGAVRCGAVERPGLAEVDDAGRWRGLEVDLCRAVAFVVLGSTEKITFDSYETPAEFDRVRHGEDDLFFLSGREIAVHKLAGAALLGPTIYVANVGVMVPGDSPARHVADLEGKGLCFMSGGRAESTLEDYFESRGKTWLRHPYTELGEMNDAYAVQRCHALAAETTELAHTRLQAGPARLKSRILPETLDVFPVLTATGVQDGRWSALVNWVVVTVIAAERPDRKWFAGGAGAMPIAGGDFGLAAGWQGRLVKAVGNYGTLYEHNLGAESPYGLERALSANQLAGGVLMAPFVE